MEILFSRPPQHQKYSFSQLIFVFITSCSVSFYPSFQCCTWSALRTEMKCSHVHLPLHAIHFIINYLTTVWWRLLCYAQLSIASPSQRRLIDILCTRVDRDPPSYVTVLNTHTQSTKTTTRIYAHTNNQLPTISLRENLTKKKPYSF